MTNSDRFLAQHDLAQRSEGVVPVTESENEHPVSTGVAAVSGGLAGALIGQLVAGRLGAAIGAVVGGVAGVAIGKDEGVAHTIEGAVDTVKDTVQDKVEDLKPAADHAIDAVKETAQDAKSSVTHAVEIAKSKFEDVKSSVETAVEHPPESPKTLVQSTVDPAVDVIANTNPLVTATAGVVPVSASDIPGGSQRLTESDRPLSVDEEYELGVRLGKEENLTGAIAAFQSVIKRDPEYAEAHYNLGVVLGKHGFREQGVSHIERARDLCILQGRSTEADNIEQILQRLTV